MSFFSSVSTSSAKNAVRYLFSFVSSDYADALTFGADIEADCTIATQEARAVGLLAGRRVLTPGGGPLALRAAVAEADDRLKRADNAIQSATARLADMSTALGDNGPGVGDARQLLATAEKNVTTAKAVNKLLQAAHGSAVPWYVQDGRLTCGVAARLDSLEKTRPGSTGALPGRLAQARGELDAAPGCHGTKWDDRAIAAATNTARLTIDQLLVDLGKLEGGLGQDAEANMFELREQALRRYAEQGTAGWSEMFDRTLARLQLANPDLRAAHLSDLNDVLNGEMMRARQEIVGAATPAELQEAVEAALKSLRAAMATLAKKVESVAGLGRIQASAEQKLQDEQEREAYADAVDEVAAEPERLRIAEAPDYPDLREKFDKIRQNAEQAGDLATATATDLPALKNLVKQAAKAHKKDVDRQLNPLREIFEQLEEQYDQKKYEIGDSEDGGVQALLAAIGTDLRDAADFLDCQGNVAAAQPAADILAHAEQLLTEFDDAAEELTRQAGEIKKLATRLGRVDRKIVPADDIAAVQRKITALEAALGGMTDAELQEGCTSIGAAIGRLETFVTELADWRKTARQDLVALENTYRAYAAAVKQATFSGPPPDPAKGGVRALLDALTQMVAAPASLLSFTADRALWGSRLLAAQQALAAVWTGTALKSPEEAVRDGKVGADRERAAEEARSKAALLKQALQQAGKPPPSSETARGELQILEQALQAASPLISTDPQAALLQLEDIEARLARLPGTPAFNEAITRAIGQIPGQWRGAIALTKQRLGELGQAVGTAATGSPFAGSMGAVNGLLDHAVDGFDPAAFNATVAVLTDSNKTPEQRRAAREQALRTLRQYQALLMGDPLTRHVQRNPFKVPVYGALFRLLEAIELELSRAA